MKVTKHVLHLDPVNGSRWEDKEEEVDETEKELSEATKEVMWWVTLFDVCYAKWRELDEEEKKKNDEDRS